MGEAFFKTVVAGLCAAGVLAPSLAGASPAKDIQAAARVLTFLDNGPSGRTVVGVVFNPDKPSSVSEKNAIMAALGSGYSAGGVTVVGRPIEAGDIGGVKVAFVTHGVNYAAVGADAKNRHVITIGSDAACVFSGACAVGISTDPTVQIIVNHASAAAVGAVFKAAFRMMIHEM